MFRRALLVVLVAGLAACQGYKVSRAIPASVQVDNDIVPFTLVPPNVMIVQDTSGSMCEPIQPADGSGNACTATAGGSETGYCSFCQMGYSSNVATAADCDPATGSCATKMELTASAVAKVLTELGPAPGQLNLGLASFPAAGADQCGAGNIQVPIGDATGTIPKIIGAYNLFEPAGGTPTDATLLVAAADPALTQGSGTNNAILLVTDGLPNCSPTSACTTQPWSDGKAWGCASPAAVAATGSNAAPPAACTCSFGSCPTGGSSYFCCPVDMSSKEAWYCLDDSNTVATIAALYKQGIKTYVLGMGNSAESNPAVMNAMAAAGGTVTAYQASTPAGLIAALQLILPQFGSCQYSIQGAAVSPELISVSLNGQSLVAGDPNGYTFSAPSLVTLMGNACTTAQSGADVLITAIAN